MLTILPCDKYIYIYILYYETPEYFIYIYIFTEIKPHLSTIKVLVVAIIFKQLFML